MFANPFINFCARFYNWIIWMGSNLQSIFLLFIRLIWGHQFILVGYGKLTHFNEASELFQTLGIILPELHVVMSGSAELIFGICMLFGFASRLAAIPLILNMLAAIGYSHNHIFSDFHFIDDPSLLVREAPFPFLMASIIVFIFGPGRLSIDAWIKRLSANWKKY